MKKEDFTIYDEKPKRTSKVVMVIAVIIAILFTILPCIGVVVALFLADDGIYTKFEENKVGEILLDKKVKIYDVNSLQDVNQDDYYIQGYLENISGNDIEYIYIEYLVYGTDDILLGTASCSIDDLKVDTTWRFKAVYSEIDSNEVSRFELSKVEIY